MLQRSPQAQPLTADIATGATAALIAAADAVATLVDGPTVWYVAYGGTVTVVLHRGRGTGADRLVQPSGGQTPAALEIAAGHHASREVASFGAAGEVGVVCEVASYSVRCELRAAVAGAATHIRSAATALELTPAAVTPPSAVPLETGPELAIAGILRAARVASGADLTFLGEFVEDRQVFRNLDGEATRFGLAPGDSQPLDESYCMPMTRGQIAPVIGDTGSHPSVADKPVTADLGIGSYVGAPVTLPDGRLFGALCGINREARPDLGPAEQGALRALADVLAQALVDVTDERLALRRAAIAEQLAAGAPRLVFQPVVVLETGALEGYEALARFDSDPTRSPAAWFTEAAAVGLGVQLEVQAVRTALGVLAGHPEVGSLAVNVSPETVFSPALAAALETVDPARVVLEVTEHAPVADYGALSAALAPLRAAGLRLAVDDAGAGFASLQHVLALEPDIVKLDRSLTSGVHRDTRRRALAAALVSFAGEVNATIVAEGVEEQAERDVLIRLGVPLGQGWLFGRPGPLPGP